MAVPALTLRQVVCGHNAPPGSASGSTGGFELAVERLSIHRGEAVAFAGPSGSGKSTLLDLLALTLRPRAMTVFTLATRAGEAIDIGGLWHARDEDRLTATRAAHLGYVLQQGGLLPFLSVRQNIGLGQAVLGRPDPERIETLARRLEIDALLDRKPATLSVGQRQRVAIGRALAHRPAIVLADEPTASVHPALADTILALLIEQARRDDTALILTTHDPDRAERHGFEVVRLGTEARAGGGVSSVRRDTRVSA
jgi:putative ABC transport system ATP-binding protein